MAIFYDWYCIETSPAGRLRRRKLRWKMTENDTIAWAAAHPGKQLEMVPDSGEERIEGGYVGWGQAHNNDLGRID